jgi:hypothetical protein
MAMLWGIQVTKVSDGSTFWLSDGFNTGTPLTYANVLDATSQAALQAQTNSQGGAYGFMQRIYSQ